MSFLSKLLRQPKFLILLTLYIVIPIAIVKITPLITPPSRIPTQINANTVPELPQILADDQTTRLLATRKLAERVGVDAALEIVQRSSLPHTGEGHLAVHQIGFAAYRAHGLEGILHCKDYFLYACYHGVIIEAATDQGEDAIKRMTDLCKSYSARHFQCVHAAGHAIMAMFSYDLSASLKVCDRLYEGDTEFPDALSSCHNGAFMENLFGVHDWGKDNPQPQREWLKDDDPYFPCNAFGEKYQRGCWLNQAARIYQMYQGDIPKTVKACEDIGNDQYTLWCIDNVARQIHPLTAGNVSKVFELCHQVGDYWQEKCIVINAGSYGSVGDPQSAITICNSSLSPQAKTECFNTVIGQIIPDPNLNSTQKTTLCHTMAPPFASQCLSSLQR